MPAPKTTSSDIFEENKKFNINLNLILKNIKKNIKNVIFLKKNFIKTRKQKREGN